MQLSLKTVLHNPSKVQLWAEFILFFIAFPFSFLTQFYKEFPLMLVLILLGLLIFFFLYFDKSFDNKLFFRYKVSRRIYMRIAIVFLISAAVMTLMIWYIDSSKLFLLIKKRPWLLLLISVFYPLFSVVPQGLAYRALFFHRYGRLFNSEIIRIIVAAAIFSLGHILYKNAFVLLLTFVGGLLFAYRYRQTNSLAVSVLEHSLLGIWLFACGLGTFFVSSMIE
jgi:uncharacterized protein